MMNSARRLTAISLYTGLGGLDFGFEVAGFRTAAALEFDPVACRVLATNRRSWRIIKDDIADVTPKEILNVAGLAPGEADVLIGGPPCQPFSKSGYWASGDTRRLKDPRANTLKSYFRVLRETRPRAFLLENVLGLSYAGKGEGLDLIRRVIASINAEIGVNYSVAVEAMNAVYFGVPQIRERVFVVGSRDGNLFKFPKPTHGVKEEMLGKGGSNLAPYLTAWDAIGDLPPDTNDPDLMLSGKWADLLPSIPEGHNYLWHTPRGSGEPLFGWRTRYWNFLLKLAKDRPSWTIQAQPGPATGPFHWRNRRLSAVELARLQTLPKSLVLTECSMAEVQRLIGNAVPSALAEVLAREIKVQFFGSRRSSKRLQLIPEKRIDLPAAERAQKVPHRYLALAGPHAEHPGKGKGAGALRRLSRVA
jgi:DNA (cytosine-5)-methyltransferase 1